MKLTVKFRQRFNDENDSDESRKTFFGESSEVANEGRKIEGHDDDAEEASPKADVQPEVHVVNLKLNKKYHH